MTNPPAGWYPDPTGEAQRRWWNGSAWAKNVQQPDPRRPRPARTVWGFAFLNLVSLFIPLSLLESHPITVDTEIKQPVLWLGLWGALVLLLILVIGTVLLAWVDSRELRAWGLDRPWPWLSAIALPVYLVGRAVRVQKRFQAGLVATVVALVIAVLPIWLTISQLESFFAAVTRAAAFRQ